MEGVKAQYDTKEKLEFYAQVMGDGTANIHFGKWDGVDLEQEGAYGKASEQMTDYMFDLATKLQGGDGKISYVDLGSGTGAAALRLCQKHDSIEKATCLNLCDEQNALATKRAEEEGLSERITVVGGTYEEAPFEVDSFDVAFPRMLSSTHSRRRKPLERRCASPSQEAFSSFAISCVATERAYRKKNLLLSLPPIWSMIGYLRRKTSRRARRLVGRMSLLWT